MESTLNSRAYLIIAGLCLLLALGIPDSPSLKAFDQKSNTASVYVPDTVPPVQINHEMLRMFDDFKKRGAINETFYFRLLQTVENDDVERWRQLLEEYRGAIASGEDPFKSEDFIELITEEVESFAAQEEKEETAPDSTPSAIPDTAPRSEPALTTSTITIIPGSQDIVRYHIQIAASRQPLEEHQIRRMYHGPEVVNSFMEDDWHKYYIGHFHAFANAREVLREIDVKGAFIIAFIIDEKLIAYRARQIERIFAASTLQTFHNDPEDRFRIQIGASKRPLRENDLKNIFSDIEQIGMIYEDQWYKYSIPGAPTLRESWRIARETGIEGAFVVRYKNGRRLSLR